VDQTTVLAELTSYVSKELLAGQSAGLEPSTPLIEWGVINSIEIARLIAFINRRFGVSVPGELIVLDNFKNLESISKLVMARLSSTDR